MFRKCEKCGNPMGAAVGRVCDRCREAAYDDVMDRVNRHQVATDAAAELVPGQLCPTCGKPVGLNNKERQKRWRQRRKSR